MAIERADWIVVVELIFNVKLLIFLGFTLYRQVQRVLREDWLDNAADVVRARRRL